MDSNEPSSRIIAQAHRGHGRVREPCPNCMSGTSFTRKFRGVADAYLGYRMDRRNERRKSKSNQRFPPRRSFPGLSLSDGPYSVMT